MAQEIDSGKLFIKDLFQKWYRIPEYQRPYVWGTDQIVELLEDIYNASQSNPESQYFLGSIVLKKNIKQETGTNTKYEEYDLLDGQQRLITLLLIHAVVRDLTSNTDRMISCRNAIFQKANPDDNVPERCRIVFDIREEVADFINEFLMTDKGTLKKYELTDKIKNDKDISIQNISQAILSILEFFENNLHSLDAFFPYFRSNVLMIYVAADLLEDAFHLFTVMNNRGIKLRNSDILKAENLAKIEIDFERKKYAKKWEETEEYFGEDFDNFLSHLRTILVKQRTGYNLLKEFEENIYDRKEFDRTTKIYINKPPLLIKGKSTLDFIDKYYKNYLYLFEESNEIEFNNHLELLKTGYEADYWKAALLCFYEKFKIDGLLQFIKLLDKKFSSDWIVGFTTTRRIDNLNEIIKRIESSYSTSTLFDSNVFDIQKEDLKRILSGNIYGRKYAKYILLKIDLAYHGDTSQFLPPPTISIEHILPQNPSDKSDWISHFTAEEREEWTNKLGNLILISRRKNTAQGNLDYEKKKANYFKKNIELFSNSVKVLTEYDSWKLDDLKKNHKEKLTKLLSLYDINDQLTEI